MYQVGISKMKSEIVRCLLTEISVIFSARQLKISREGQTIFKARVLAQNITCHAQLSLRFYGQCHGTREGPGINNGCNIYIVDSVNSNLQGKLKEVRELRTNRRK